MNASKNKTLAVERLDRRGGLIEALAPVGWLFGWVSGLRGWLYDRRFLRADNVGVPVICVGNIVAGGTGKTPMVVELARRLVACGRQPGILSRGYRGAGADGADSDEARLFGELLGDLPRVAMPDRVRGAQLLIEAGADVIVMDDGFQHRRLVRDLDLVLVDATRPWGLAHGPRAFLPRGLLREGPGALGRAGAVVLTRTDLVDPEVLGQLELEIERLVPKVPRILTRHVPLGLRPPGHSPDLGRASSQARQDRENASRLEVYPSNTLGAGESIAPAPLDEKMPRAGIVESFGRCSVDRLRGLEVDVISAIGNPAAFEATLVGLGARLVLVRRFADHHEYIAQDLSGLGKQRPLLTTAKDAVKLTGVLVGRASKIEVLVLDMTIEVERGHYVLDTLIDAALQACAHADGERVGG